MTQYAILYNASHFDIHNLRTHTNCKLSYFVREKVFILVFVYEPEFFCVSLCRTRWGNNSNTRGSYSFIKVGASMTDIDLLAEPLTDMETEKVFHNI